MFTRATRKTGLSFTKKEEELGGRAELTVGHGWPRTSKRSCWYLSVWKSGNIASSQGNLSVDNVIGVTKSQDSQCKVSEIEGTQ